MEDRAGLGLKAKLEKYLGDQGNVLAVQIVPPFHKIFQIEVQMRDLRDLNMLLIFEDKSSNCCIPRKYRDLAQFEAKMEGYE